MQILNNHVSKQENKKKQHKHRHLLSSTVTVTTQNYSPVFMISGFHWVKCESLILFSFLLNHRIYFTVAVQQEHQTPGQ